MNNIELMPTEENIIRTLDDDLLNRNQQLSYVLDFLLLQDTGYTIAIDGRWGSGKTFFVKQLDLILKSINPYYNMESEKKKQILNKVPFHSEEVKDESNGQISVYYDAWENDNDEDPIFSLVLEITKQLGLEYYFNENDFINKACDIVEFFSGKDVKKIVSSLKSSNLLSNLKNEKNIKTKIKDFFSDIIPERGKRLVLFIDELDRCKPSYAVHLLERIKHYMCDERITFVFAVNLEQLQHTIKHYYGSYFDAGRYLDRFFNMRLTISIVDMSKFYDQLGLNNRDSLEMVCKRFIEVYGLGLREIIRYYSQVRYAVYKPTHKKPSGEIDYPYQRTNKCILKYIVPIMIGLRSIDLDTYNKFVRGKDVQPLIDIYEESEIGDYFVNEILGQYSINNNDNREEKKNKIMEFYTALFIKQYTISQYQIKVGKCEFNEQSKKVAFEAASSISQYSDYNI